MKHSVCTLAVGAFLGSVVTLAVGSWMHGSMENALAEGGGAAAPSGNGDVNGDGRLDISDPIYMLNWLFGEGPGPLPIACPRTGLPATGQTKCYDKFNAEIACDSGAYPGQDGFCKSGCPTEGRFVDNLDGTVTDTCTGLMWQQDTELGAYDWQEALLYCDRFRLGDHTDWRLPNVRELLSIVDYGRVEPAIDPVFDAESFNYWSSTNHNEFPQYAWYINFYGGNAVLGMDKLTVYYVRAVRNAE
jgi:hypothetical protein